MALLGVGSAVSRRAVVAVGLAAVLCGGISVGARQAPAQGAPAAPPAPQADAFKFTTDAALVIWVIKPEGAADFEGVWKTIRAKLAASAKPELKALGDSLKVFKADGGATAEGFTYFFTADPVAKDSTYNPTFLLYEAGLFERAEADDLFGKLSKGINQIRPVGMIKMP